MLFPDLLTQARERQETLLREAAQERLLRALKEARRRDEATPHSFAGLLRAILRALAR
jgi:hypothetical protein